MGITYCIPSKNNLRYLKNSIRSIQKNAHDFEIIVYVDSDNDGTEQWLLTNKIKYSKNTSNIPNGIAYGYNRCIEMASNDIVCMFHADMFMGNGFEDGIYKYLTPNQIVSATRIEPPLHPPGMEKIVMDFGMYPEDFRESDFEKFISNNKSQTKITRGIFAPWICYKKDIVEIGMHDEHFHSYHEDTDIFQRFLLKGMNVIQSWDSMVYHLTCRGGQFQDGIEKITTDTNFHAMKEQSFKHFIRKWGHLINNDQYCKPILSPRYDTAFVIKNITDISQIITLEPWCDNMFIGWSDNAIEKSVRLIQETTKFNISSKIKNLADIPANNIVIEFDMNRFTSQHLELITNIPRMLEDSGEIGNMEYDIFKFHINKLEQLQSRLIHADDAWYLSKLK